MLNFAVATNADATDSKENFFLKLFKINFIAKHWTSTQLSVELEMNFWVQQKRVWIVQGLYPVYNVHGAIGRKEFLIFKM